jgi:peptide-methionine (S)-S-oxide reductase
MKTNGDNNNEVAVFGGGCFWCTEAVFTEIKGVTSVVSGYSGGHTENPTYYQVCAEKTGHAEVVRVEFDPSQITFSQLLEVFFATHDPTTVNRQGADQGARYRSVILHTSDAQNDQALEFIKALDASGTENGPVVTEIAQFERFFAAEAEHMQFYLNNPGSMYCQIVISPKVAKVRQKFAKSLR